MPLYACACTIAHTCAEIQPLGLFSLCSLGFMHLCTCALVHSCKHHRMITYPCADKPCAVMHLYPCACMIAPPHTLVQLCPCACIFLCSYAFVLAHLHTMMHSCFHALVLSCTCTCIHLCSYAVVRLCSYAVVHLCNDARQEGMKTTPAMPAYLIVMPSRT